MKPRSFDESTSWQNARKQLRYTAATLRTELGLQHLAQRCNELLALWDELELARFRADDQHCDATALLAHVEISLESLFPTLLTTCDEALRSRLEQRVSQACEDTLSYGRFLNHNLAPEWSAKEHAGIHQELQRLLALGEDALWLRSHALREKHRVWSSLRDWREQSNQLRRAIADEVIPLQLHGKSGAELLSNFFLSRRQSHRPEACASAV